MYEALKNLRVVSMGSMGKDDLEEALVAVTQLADGYSLAQINPPNWLLEKLREVRRYYDIAVENALEAENRMLEAEQVHDMTPSERRNRRQERIDHNMAELARMRGGNKPAPTTATPTPVVEVHEH